MSSDGRGLTTAVRVLAWLVLAQLALIAVNGVYLYFNYRPVADGVDVRTLHPAVRRAAQLRDVHVLESRLLLLSAAALMVLVMLRPVRSWWNAASGAWQMAMVVLASFSGLLLPWDQLGLYAVTVGTNLRGFEPIVEGSNVRFVLIGGSEVSSSTIVRWLVVHIAAGVLACAGPIVVLRGLRLRTGRARAERGGRDAVAGDSASRQVL